MCRCNDPILNRRALRFYDRDTVRLG
jgi:hypothetical protein